MTIKILPGATGVLALADGTAARVLKAWQGREERRDDVAVVTFRPNDLRAK